jgi:predicted N-acetyltransferase YhbS
MNYLIEPVAKHIELIPVLAHWHHQEWQHLNPESYDLQSRIKEYQEVVNSPGLPAMLVAHNNSQALGSVRLIKNDMDTHPELGPWLASLYVHPDFRRQGIATSLIRELEDVTRQLGFQDLYLFTEDRQQMYQKLGWQQLLIERYYNEQVVIMVKHLNR